MAVVNGLQSSGSQSPTSVSRTIEKVFDEAQYTGEINLSGRKLKDYPKCACKYDLCDTTVADLSKNRFSEIPSEVCCCTSVEKLNCYHNVIKCLPMAIIQLQNLVYLNLSRNLLSVIPPTLCQLEQLQVLLAGNNRLVSLPEEIGRLRRLQQLDVSCNEITHLPDKIGDMESLRNLDVRKNLLVELPISICRLRLRRLDFSCNRIAHIPCDIRKVQTLEQLMLESNPLLSPPASICTRGLVHIMKFLNLQAMRSETRKDILRGDYNVRGTIKRSQSCLPSARANDESDANSRSSRSMLISNGNGAVVVANENCDRSAWSNCEFEDGDNVCQSRSPIRPMFFVEDNVIMWNSVSSDNVSKALAVKAAESSKGHRSTDQSNIEQSSEGGRSPKSLENLFPRVSLKSPRSPEYLVSGDADEFTKELQRQKAEYDARRKRAEQVRLSVEEADKEDRRRQSEKQVVVVTQQQSDNDRYQPRPNTTEAMPHSRSFSEVTRQTTTWQAYNRSNSSTSYKHVNGYSAPSQSGYGVSATTDQLASNNSSGSTGKGDNGLASRQSQTLPRRCATPSWDNNSSSNSNKAVTSTDGTELPLESEFRRQHEALIAQQRREAYNILRRLEEMQQSQLQSNGGSFRQLTAKRIDEESASTRSIERSSSDGSCSIASSDDVMPSGGQRGAVETEFNGGTPVRRNSQFEADSEQEQLRQILEAILKIKLPEDVLGALRDGVILCHLANHMRPHSVTSIHVPLPAVPKLTPAKSRRNVENFLLACRRVGVSQSRICSASAILDEGEQNVTEVISTVRALIECTTQFAKQSSV